MESMDTGKGFRLAAQRAVGEPDRQIEFMCQPRHAVDVIAMLMRDDNAAQLFGRHIQARQPREGVLQAEAAVHQYQRPANCDQQRVALAAAAQRGKLHEANCTLFVDVLVNRFKYLSGCFVIRVILVGDGYFTHRAAILDVHAITLAGIFVVLPEHQLIHPAFFSLGRMQEVDAPDAILVFHRQPGTFNSQSGSAP